LNWTCFRPGLDGCLELDISDLDWTGAVRSALSLRGFWKLFVENFRPALTVAIVSVPLSISLALASQASPLMGILTAIYGGLFGAAIGGSPFNVQG
jgi:MFS superfamily sulfate permease-like transporter